MYIVEPITLDKPATESSHVTGEASTPPWVKDKSYLSTQPPSVADNSETLSEEDVEKALVKHSGVGLHQGEGENALSGITVSPFVSFAMAAPPIAWTMNRLTSTLITSYGFPVKRLTLVSRSLEMWWKGDIDVTGLKMEVFVEFDQYPGSSNQFTGTFWTRTPSQTQWAKYWMNEGVVNGNEVSWKVQAND
ncbi:hypothetical protein EIP86_002797 [Pleurotus ostreatoroseus]|nr:hypothetical protein EIP86_002797 [Pleurotus ostreatoroseus]